MFGIFRKELKLSNYSKLTTIAIPFGGGLAPAWYALEESIFIIIIIIIIINFMAHSQNTSVNLPVK